MADPILGASAVDPLPDDSWQRRWRCSACENSFSFYSGNPRFLPFCTYCVAKIVAHAESLGGVSQDNLEGWSVVVDDWLQNGVDLSEALQERDAAEFKAWAGGGPSTPGAQRYARSKVAPRAR